MQLVQAAEAKAYYGLTRNHAALQALTEALVDKGSLTGQDVREILAASGTQMYETPYVHGFGFGRDGSVFYPGKVTATCACSLCLSIGAHLDRLVTGCSVPEVLV